MDLRFPDFPVPRDVGADVAPFHRGNANGRDFADLLNDVSDRGVRDAERSSAGAPNAAERDTDIDAHPAAKPSGAPDARRNEAQNADTPTSVAAAESPAQPPDKDTGPATAADAVEAPPSAPAADVAPTEQAGPPAAPGAQPDIAIPQPPVAVSPTAQSEPGIKAHVTQLAPAAAAAPAQIPAAATLKGPTPTSPESTMQGANRASDAAFAGELKPDGQAASAADKPGTNAPHPADAPVVRTSVPAITLSPRTAAQATSTATQTPQPSADGGITPSHSPTATDGAAAPGPARTDDEPPVLIRPMATSTGAIAPQAPTKDIASAPDAIADTMLQRAAADLKAAPAESAKSESPTTFGKLAAGTGVAAQITGQQDARQSAAIPTATEAKAASAASDANVSALLEQGNGDAPKAADAATPTRPDPALAVDTAPTRNVPGLDAASAARSTRPAATPVVTQVVAHVVQAAIDRNDKISIRLSPAELGRIDVRLDFGPDGRIQAVFAADRPQTVDMLQRDARELERALQDAGLKTDSGSLSFNLRGENRDSRPTFAASSHDDTRNNAAAETLVPQLQAYAARGSPGRLDIRV